MNIKILNKKLTHILEDLNDNYKIVDRVKELLLKSLQECDIKDYDISVFEHDDDIQVSLYINKNDMTFDYYITENNISLSAESITDLNKYTYTIENIDKISSDLIKLVKEN